MKILISYSVLFLGTILYAHVYSQQVPDTAYRFGIRQAAYDKGKGPLILIDAAHNNFHTRDGGFFALAKLLEDDGYRVGSLDKIIAGPEALNGCKILIIANALNTSNAENWVLPTPSAFSNAEIFVLKQWVEKGGSLLLIADHMPFAGAASDLGKAFGFEFINGFAITGEGSWPPSVFSVHNGTLQYSPVTKGIKDYEKVDSVATFTGSAFKSPGGSINVLSFLGDNISLQPDTAWRFNNNTPVQHLEGFQQGALLNSGKGKVAVFGEAAMFTAQVANSSVKVGFNSETAPQNAQFALNLIHWLDGIKEYKGIMEREK